MQPVCLPLIDFYLCRHLGSFYKLHLARAGVQLAAQGCRGEVPDVLCYAEPTRGVLGSVHRILLVCCFITDIRLHFG